MKYPLSRLSITPLPLRIQTYACNAYPESEEATYEACIVRVRIAAGDPGLRSTASPTNTFCHSANVVSRSTTNATRSKGAAPTRVVRPRSRATDSKTFQHRPNACEHETRS